MSFTERTEAECAAFMLLVASGEECQHPPQYRHEIPTARPFEAKRLDPREWECALCGTWQVARGAADHMEDRG